MTYVIVFVVIIVFYWLTKNYNSHEYQHIQLEKKHRPSGTLAEHETGLLAALKSERSHDVP